MLYHTKDLRESGETEYSIKKKVEAGKFRQVARGLYTDDGLFAIDEECSSQRKVGSIFFVITPSLVACTTIGRRRYWSGGSGRGFALISPP